MRKFVTNFVTVGVLITSTQMANAADSLIVTLSDPSKPAIVRTELMAGSINVSTHSGRDVIIVTREAENGFAFQFQHFMGSTNVDVRVPQAPEFYNISTKEPDPEKVRGLKKIQASGFGVSVEEEDNVIDIIMPPASLFNGNARILDVKVPRKTSLNLECMGGNVDVENVEGTIEVEAMGGGITLTEISGTVVAHTMGNITATINRVAPNKPMSFSSFNGEIDVTLPKTIKATLVLESHGDIYTDFDTSKRRLNRNVKESRRDNFHVAETEELLEIPLNGGGPEIRFTNFSGNIYIRKGN